MKCIVTGGEGFIGSHVVSDLARRGFEVVSYDVAPHVSQKTYKNITAVQGDIRNSTLLREAIEHADLVFHLAGILGTEELFQNPKNAIDVNINGALNVLLAASQRQRIFFPAKPNQWNNVYSVTSQAVEKLGHTYHEYMGLDVRVLRFRNVFGPRQKILPIRKVVPVFILQALTGHPIEIFGDGCQPVEFQYVENVARMIVDYTIRDIKPTETHEIKAQITMTVSELASHVVQITGSKSAISHIPMRKGEPSNAILQHAPDVQDIVDNGAVTPFSIGMERTVDWYSKVSDDILLQAMKFYNFPGEFA